jgi:hypothetical protein
MQNKANLWHGRMEINSCSKKNYENISDWTLGENKPNSNPIKANFKRDLAKMGHHETSEGCNLKMDVLFFR